MTSPDQTSRTIRRQLVDGINRFERGRFRRRMVALGVVVLLGLVGTAVVITLSGSDEPDLAVDGGAETPLPVVVDTTSTSTTVDAGPAPAPDDFIFPLCDSVPDLEAPASWYRDTPIYVINEQPKEPVRAWAETKADYEQSWVDPAHLRWITVGFSGPVDDYQIELEELFPDIGVVAVQVPFTQAELDAVRDRVEPLLADLDSWSLFTSINSGYVGVGLGVLIPERIALLASLEGEPICIEGSPAADLIEPGPQPEGGDGWRLLADEKVGPSYSTGVATSPAQYDELWQSIGLTAEPPEVDFEFEIVVWFGAVYGSGCEIRLDDVLVDRDAALVHTLTVIPGNPASCNGDANPRAYVVALDRARLPRGPFMIQLRATVPPRGAPEERTLVAVDLSAPGAEAADDEIGFDPSLPVEGQGPPSLAQTYPFPGEPVTFPIELSCAGYVGDVWDFSWTNAETAFPDEWLALAVGDTVSAEIVLAVNPPVLTVTVGGVGREYFPVALGASCE